MNSIFWFLIKKMYFYKNVSDMTTQLILNLDSVEDFSRILQLLKEFGFENKIQIKTKAQKPTKTALKPRQAGWGKDFFAYVAPDFDETDRKSTRLNSSHVSQSRMPSSA